MAKHRKEKPGAHRENRVVEKALEKLRERERKLKSKKPLEKGTPSHPLSDRDY